MEKKKITGEVADIVYRHIFPAADIYPRCLFIPFNQEFKSMNTVIEIWVYLQSNTDVTVHYSQSIIWEEIQEHKNIKNGKNT